MKGLESLLAAQPFITGMNPVQIHKIAQCASFLELPGGRHIFRQGEAAKDFYLILDGTAEN